MKRILSAVVMLIWVTGLHAATLSSTNISTVRPVILPKTVNPPVLFPGVVPMNPVIQSIQNACNDAKKLVDSCNLCQAAKDQAKDQAKAQCDAERQQQSSSQDTQCNQDVTEALQSGSQMAWAEVKGKAPQGYFFHAIGNNSCESFCSRVVAKDGHMMTCIASVKVEGGCLSRASITPGSCQATGEDVDCYCI